MFKKIHLISLTFFWAMTGITLTAQTPPNEVFQRTDTVLVMLDKMNEANFTTVTAPNDLHEPALPRHVLQTGREV
ncbi:MAG: hypothetical protein ABJL99_16835 [Aliishimia sp.]